MPGSESRIDNGAIGSVSDHPLRKGLPTVVLSAAAGLFTLFGTLLGAYFQGNQNLALEREKAQNEVIIKVIETGDTEKAKKNLLFLIAAGLIKDPDGKIARAAADPKTAPVLPAPSLPTLDLGYRVPASPRNISEIIISDTQSSDVEAELAGLSQFHVSYHYLITESGETRRLVDESLIAFHTTGHNDSSIGIGLMHVHGHPYSADQRSALVRLLADIAGRNSIRLDRIYAKSTVDPHKVTDLAPEMDAVRKEVDAKRAGAGG